MFLLNTLGGTLLNVTNFVRNISRMLKLEIRVNGYYLNQSTFRSFKLATLACVVPLLEHATIVYMIYWGWLLKPANCDKDLHEYSE